MFEQAADKVNVSLLDRVVQGRMAYALEVRVSPGIQQRNDNLKRGVEIVLGRDASGQ